MAYPPSPLATYIESWTPCPITDEDDLSAAPVAAMSALLDQSEAVATDDRPLPPLWHWLYFLHWPAQNELGADGHPRSGHFLPPLPHRQRMFAGGRCEVNEPLRLGERTLRISSLEKATAKYGSTGELLFVTLRHEFRQRGRTCLVEEQDIVYRSGGSPRQDRSAAPGSITGLPSGEPWQLSLLPDPTLLFRFSALTANAHRIHYDMPYARGQEGHPGLLVHGPLLALLMLELPRRNAPLRRIKALTYQLRKPVFAGEHLLAGGTPSQGHADLHISTGRDARSAAAEVSFA
ncbi:hypothetical protein [Streptomyces sp. cg40]|uniref:hypothetical protein n=1 Tax=Streptomyces sp. cg40 TaxID=3419764 RepID=UPI003CFFFB99